MTKGQNRGVGSHNAIMLLNDESVELIKETLPSPALTLGTTGEWSNHDEPT